MRCHFKVEKKSSNQIKKIKIGFKQRLVDNINRRHKVRIHVPKKSIRCTFRMMMSIKKREVEYFSRAHLFDFQINMLHNEPITIMKKKAIMFRILINQFQFSWMLERVSSQRILAKLDTSTGHKYS